MIATAPHIDATGVAADQLITIEFSEAMNRGPTRKVVFIAPHTDCDFGWRGAQVVEIRPRRGLQPRQTYVVTVGTDAVDRRGNRLEAAHTFAFTTGEQLDTGSISGRVAEDMHPAPSAHVWAYDMRRFSGTVGADEPAYRTQTGADGSYEFQRLSPGHYRILAFADSDRNARYDDGEPIAVPGRDIELGDGIAAVAGGLSLAASRERELAIVRIQALESRKILLVFNEGVDPGTVLLDVEGLEIDKLYGGSDRQRVYATTAEQEGGRTYTINELMVAGRSLTWGEAVRGRSRGDTKRPSIETITPSDFATVGDSLSLLFSEAMEPTAVDESFWIASDSTQALAGRFRWQHPNELVFWPDLPLQAASHRLAGRLGGLADLAGLAPADSIVTFEFEVLGAAELSRISGKVGAVGSAPAIIQVSRKDGSTRVSVVADSAGTYSIAGLLPGAYRLFAYQDENGNNRFDKGSLDPFEPAEPNTSHADLISATRGSSAEGVDLELR